MRQQTAALQDFGPLNVRSGHIAMGDSDLVIVRFDPLCGLKSDMFPYSTTSSASASSVFGTLSPIAFAVFRLSANRKRVGCSTGRSAV